MVIKVTEKFAKTTSVKNKEKSEEYLLGGERNASYSDRLLY